MKRLDTVTELYGLEAIALTLRIHRLKSIGCSRRYSIGTTIHMIIDLRASAGSYKRKILNRRPCEKKKRTFLSS
jgi:hypothetical protein